MNPLSFFSAADPLSSVGLLLAAAVPAGAVSLWLLLPRGRKNRIAGWLGLALGGLSLAGFVATGRRLGGVGEEAVFLTVSPWCLPQPQS